MNWGELLQGLYVPEFRHRPFPSPERLVWIFSPVVEPPAAFLVSCIADHIHRCPVWPKPVRNDHPWLSIPLHRAPQKLKRSRAISLFRGVDLEHFTFMINRAPQIMCLAIDTHEHLVQVPAPLWVWSAMNSPLPDLCGEQRTEPVPTEPHRLMTNVDATLGQQVLDLAQL